MKLTTASLATALLTAFPAVLAGLEDAKHSVSLRSLAHFASSID